MPEKSRGYDSNPKKKKIRQGECRTFAFSVIPPTSLTYILIIKHGNANATKSGQFIKWHNTQFLFFKFMLIIEYKQFTPMNFTQPKLNLSDLKQSYNGWTDWTTWNVALWINNDECYYNIAKDCKDYMDFLFEMQSMIGSFATPDGADWGEANIEEMNEVIMEAI